MKLINKVLLSCMVLSLSLSADSSVKDSNAAAQANNPLANMKAFNIHSYLMGDLEGATSGGDRVHQAWLRYAQPVSIGETNWLIRASMPVDTYKKNGHSKTGIGDFNIFAAYLIDIGNPAVSFGVGPLLELPTGSNDVLGKEKYSLGLANVLFDASSKKYQYGYLLTYQHSFAGKSDAQTVSMGAFQPFAMYQLGGGTYLRSVGIWYYDFEKKKYSIPVGLGIGQVMKVNNTVYNLFVEPQYSIFDKGVGVAKWQVLVGLNMQFMGTN